MSNSLDPEQDYVRPDLGPNCLQSLSADNSSSYRRHVFGKGGLANYINQLHGLSVGKTYFCK